MVAESTSTTFWATIGAIEAHANLWIALGTFGLFFATVGLAYVGWYQIGHLRREAKKWRTIEACEVYDRDPILHASLKEMRKYRLLKKSGVIPTEDIKVEVVSVLNYLDGIAIGVNEGLYLEKIVKDHLGPIMASHIEDHLVSPDAKAFFEVNEKNFEHLISLNKKWKKEKLMNEPEASPPTSFKD